MKAKNARPHNVEFGIKSSAIRIPNCAEEIVAPVVGETNLFMHNCCMISPATLIPTPVHKIASKRGNREITNISICSTSPLNRPVKFKSNTPINSDHTDKISSMTAREIVKPYFLMVVPPFFFVSFH